MDLKEKLKEIELLWHQLSLPLKQDIAYVYLEKEKKEIEEIGSVLASLYKNREFRLFLKRIHKEFELDEAGELGIIFTKKTLFKEDPTTWYKEAREKLSVFFANILQQTNAFEAFEKNLHASHSMPNEPFYKVNPIPQSKLVNGEHVKVAIIGAGFSGLAAAYFLLNSGYKANDIAIIEKRKVGGGASGRAAGFLTASTEHDFIDMVELYGKEKALRYWQAAEDGINIISDVVRKTSTDASYFEENGYLYLATDEESLVTLKEESEAQNSVGKNTTILSSEQLVERFNLHGFVGALYSDRAYFVNAAELINNLQIFLLKKGVRIINGTEVRRIGKSGNTLTIFDGTEKIMNTDKTIITSNIESIKFGFLKGKIFAVETYLAVTEPVPLDFLRNHKMLFYTLMWDTDKIYTYFRIMKDGRILIGGSDIDFEGKELKSEMEFMQHFYTYLVKHFPQLKGIRFQQQWSGVLAGTNDFFPFVGNIKNTNIYVSVSDGIPYCFLSGRVVADLISKGQSEYSDLFQIDRKIPKTGVPIGQALRIGLVRKMAKPALKLLSKFPSIRKRILGR